MNEFKRELAVIKLRELIEWISFGGVIVYGSISPKNPKWEDAKYDEMSDEMKTTASNFVENFIRNNFFGDIHVTSQYGKAVFLEQQSKYILGIVEFAKSGAVFQGHIIPELKGKTFDDLGEDVINGLFDREINVTCVGHTEDPTGKTVKNIHFTRIIKTNIAKFKSIDIKKKKLTQMFTDQNIECSNCGRFLTIDTFDKKSFDEYNVFLCDEC